MEIIHLSEKNVTECAKRAEEVLRSGGVVLYPTDTLYGLGADAFSDDAVEKIYAIKEREEGKPIHCIVADLAMAEKYAEVNDCARILAKEFLPGPLTLVLKKKKGIDAGITRRIETMGIRIPNNDFCFAFARAFGEPITTTSANRSGAPSARRIDGILAGLGERAKEIDLVIDAGELPKNRPWTVVDVSSGHPVILREGAILASDIWEAIRAEL